MRAYTHELPWKVGQRITCGNPPTDGVDHRPLDGKHVATVESDDGERLKLRCDCGHSWHVYKRQEMFR